MDEEEQQVEGVFVHNLSLSSLGRNGNYLGQEDIHQQLAEKDNYLTLAAEAGQVLLEKNQELKTHYDKLQEEYLRKIESLQQDRYQLKKLLSEQDSKHESCIQELHREVSNLNGQLQTVKRSSRAIEYTTESTYENLAGQNHSLLQELENVKSYNKTLSQQVESLSCRIDEQGAVKRLKDKDASTYILREDNNNTCQVDQEIQGLKDTLKQLIDQKDILEESVSGLMKGEFNNTPRKDDVSLKFSNLEGDLYNLREQMKICQNDLHRTRKKNEKLEDQLEEYVLMQSVQGSANSSLLNELSESSIPEVDMNFRGMSTPQGDLKLANSLPNKDVIKAGLGEIYIKLARLKNELNSDNLEPLDMSDISIDMVDHLVNDVFELVQGKLTHGKSYTGCGMDSLIVHSPETASVSSQDECDVLRQQLHELNRYLDTKNDELDKVKTELLSFQNNTCTMSDKVQELTINNNAKEREIENLQNERAILMDSGDIDNRLERALQDRNDSFHKENEAKVKYETALSDMQKLNNQLVAAVKEKHELSEQLELWQFDMASVIDKQVNKNLKGEAPGKKNQPLSTQKRSFAAKFFTPKLNK